MMTSLVWISILKKTFCGTAFWRKDTQSLLDSRTAISSSENVPRPASLVFWTYST